MILVTIHQCFLDESLVNKNYEILSVSSFIEAERICNLLKESDELEGHFKSYYIHEVCSDTMVPTTTFADVLAHNNNLHLNV